MNPLTLYDSSMKRSFATLVSIMVCFIAAQAQVFTAVSESGTGLQNQTWFYSGAGKDLDQSEIKKYWNEGKRITSVAHTDVGWFVVMSKNSGYTMQTYHYASDWPTDWLREKEGNGYRITSVAHSGSKWMIVLSQGTGISTQSWYYGAWSTVKDKIKADWDKNYHVTSIVWDGDGWFVVMSKGTKYNRQSYLWAKSYSEIREKIKSYWNKGYSLRSIDYGEGEYVALMVTYADGHKPQQSFVGSSDGVSGTIKDWWNSKKSLVYIGGYGGNQKVYASTKSNSSVNANNNTSAGGYSVQVQANGSKRINLPDGGFRIVRDQSDGSQTYYEEHPCISCHGDGRCHICWGTGGTYNSYTGIFYPCRGCLGKNICFSCQGKGKTTLTGVYKNGVARGIGNDGRVYSGSADSNSGSGSGSSRSGSSSGSSRSNDYIETIVYAPNYTGGDNTQWCEKCKEYAPAHSHIRKRVH